MDKLIFDFAPPWLALEFARHGRGTVSDNRGNELRGRSLSCAGAQERHLSFAEWTNLNNHLTAVVGGSAFSFRSEIKLGGYQSPLAIECQSLPEAPERLRGRQ